MNNPPATILRLPQVKTRTGIGTTSIHKLIAAGTFPKPVPLIGRSVGWLSSEIDEWILQRVAESRAGLRRDVITSRHAKEQGAAAPASPESAGLRPDIPTRKRRPRTTRT